MTADPAADRLALRELVDAYAIAADRADGPGAATLFVPAGRMTLWLDPERDEPTGERVGREQIAATIDSLSRYRATHHAVSSSSVVVDGDRARGVTMCVAHHLEGDPTARRTRVLFIRYDDAFVRHDGAWRFERRDLHVQWEQVEDATP